MVRKKNLSGNVQVIKIVFVDNKNLNKIIHLSANSLQKSRYSNEAKATFSTLAKVDITSNGICIFEKEMPTKSRIWKWLELKWQTFSHSQWHFFPLCQMGIYGIFFAISNLTSVEKWSLLQKMRINAFNPTSTADKYLQW